MNRAEKTFAVLLTIAYSLALVAGMFYRFVDGDEGGTLVVSKEVINGRIPVLEINAHNQPLLYYFYGAWMKLFGFSITSGRSLSVLLMFATGVLLLWWARRFSRDYIVAILLYFLYVTNLTFFKADIPVKPFAPSNFLTFASFALLTGSYLRGGSIGGLTFFLSGLLLGMSLAVRLVFVLPVLFVLWIVFVLLRNGAGVKDTVKKAAQFSFGVVVPLVPSALIFIREPLRAYTIWAGAYAQIYLGKGNNPDFVVDANGANKHAMILSGLKDVVTVPDTAFLILLVAAAGMVVLFTSWRKNCGRVKSEVYLLAFLTFGAIAWVCSNLYGNYTAYVNQLVVFAILLTLPLMEEAAKRLNARRLAAALLVFIVVMPAFLYVHFQRRLHTSIFYMLRTDDRIITPAFVNAVSQDVIKKFTREGDTVLDGWGAFVFASGRRPVAGFEYPTDDGFFWHLMTNKENAAKYLFIPEPELFRRVANREFPLVILGDATELEKLVVGEKWRHASYPLRDEVEKHYDIYAKYFVKPTNAWVLIYRPKR